MAHLLAPQQYKTTLPVFYNVDGVVGSNPAVNNREDVLLVQFAFKVIAAKPQGISSPESQKVFQAVQTTGIIDQATIDAIRAGQMEVKKQKPKAVVDGRVSPASSGSYGFGGGASYFVVTLNESIQMRHTEIWPRIDKIPGCPPELTQMVIRTVRGT